MAAPPPDRDVQIALDRLAVLDERIAVQIEARDRLAATLRRVAGGKIRPVA